MNRFRHYGLIVLLVLASAARATTIVLPSDAQLVAKAPVIVDGRVVSSTVVERDGALRTETVVEVARTIKGRTGSTVVVHEIGGELEGRITKIFGTPEFQAGERVLLFLEAHPRGGYRTIDLLIGKFTEGRTRNGRRLWLRADGAAGVMLLDAALHPVAPKNVQRDANGFEAFIFDRLAGRPGKNNYGIENPVLERDEKQRGITSNFTLIDEPSTYRWSRFDTGSGASWYSSGTQPGYSNGGVSELQTAMAAWTGYSQANILYSYSGARTGTPGGLDVPNGFNEVMFNDPRSEIAGTWNSATGGVVGTGGFNGVTAGGTWTAPFTADPSHAAGPRHAYSITEGNLTIQDGVSPGNGISSNRLAEIISHEFGHTLGLGHSADSTALMYASITGLGPSLRGDDQTGARWLYPKGSTPPPIDPPAAPSELRATVSGSNIDLVWRDNASTETGQSLYLATGSGSFAKVGDVAANAQSARVSGLTSNSYRLYVVAFNSGGSSAPSNTVTATVAIPPVAAFSLTPGTGTAGQTLFTFYDESTGLVASRSWNFGDGGTSSATVATHLYTTPGQYTVTLTVSGAGQTSQTSKTIVVTGPLEASFVWSPSNATPADTIQFSDQSSGSPAAWNWNFGDGTTSSQQNPAKKYAATGSYLVTLTVYRSTTSSTTSQTVHVSESGVPVTPGVVAKFSVSSAIPAPGTDIQFTDLSTGAPTSWQWSFGDGVTSTERHPVHAYSAPGTYTVTLQARNATTSASTSKLLSVSGEAAYRTLVSVAAQTGGVGGTSWRTELTVFNAGLRDANVKVIFLPSAGGDAVVRDVALSPRQSRTYANTLLELFDITSGAGALAIEGSSAGSNANLRVSSRTFTTSESGTYGQAVPDVEPSALTRTLYITGMRSSSAYRTNIGLVNRSSSNVGATLTLFDAAGQLKATKNVDLQANSFQQSSLVSYFPEVDGQTHDALSMRLVASASDSLSAYASVIDNITQDPIYIQASDPAGGSDLTIPVIVRAPGANGTLWRSDVTLFNPLETVQVITLRAGASTTAITLAGHETRLLEDVLSVFGQSAGSSTLEVSWSGEGPVVTSRTFNSVVTGGTYGQSVDPVASYANELYVPGLRNDESYRTNVGFLNGGSTTESFSVIALTPSGNEMARATVTLPPGLHSQTAVSALLGIPNGPFTLFVQGDGNSSLFAYASMIDNRSGDPVFFAGR